MNDGQMPPEQRDRVILEFLEETNLALPLRPLYFNLRREKHATFSRATLRRRLDSLVERGRVEKLEEGNGYYQITDDGCEFLAEEDDV